MDIASLSVEELAEKLPEDKVCLLDVREPWEIEIASIAGSLSIPMNEVPERLDELGSARKDRDLVVMCHSGRRSSVIVRFLNQSGFERVFNLEGGIETWSQRIDPAMASY